jgi:hypothetical protein
MKIAAAILLTMLLAAPASAQQYSLVGDYNVVLIPVFFFGPGAYGSTWETRVTVVNTGETFGTMPVPMLGLPFDRECGPPTGELWPFHIGAICSGYNSPSGVLLYTPKALAPRDVQINARVRDLSRNAQSAGIEIPVVRQTEFREYEFLLTHIPSNPRFRVNLRLYGGLQSQSIDRPYLYRGGTLGIEIYDVEDRFMDTPLVRTSLVLSAPEFMFESAKPVRPSYVSIPDLTAAFPQLSGVAEYNIRVTPFFSLADPAWTNTYWGFATITNNETQEVTIVSP